MRSSQTLSEARLWNELRGSRLGCGFRRQAVIGEYIVDFLAPGPRVVVEVDGGYHASRGRADAQRDRALARAGYRVLRVTDAEVLRDLSAVLERIRMCLNRDAE
jgi:very-short-patch-repair endonuclease